MFWQVVSTGTKLELLRRLHDAGVRHFDVASFANPKLVPQLADGVELLRMIADDPVLTTDASLTAIVPNMRGLERFLLSVDQLGLKNCSVSIWVHASEAFSQKNMGCSVSEHMASNRVMAEALVGSGVRLRAYVSGALHCPFSGPIKADRVGELAEQLVDAAGTVPVEEIVLADTLGRGLVDEVRLAIMATQKRVKVPLGLHLHNTFGYALGVISMAVSELGVRSLEGSVAGLGGCPFAGATSLGNVATEDVASMLHQMDFETGVDVGKLVQVGKWICGEVGVQQTSCVSRLKQIL